MRARYIKPEFFKHEVLGSLDPLARLLFQGLWLLADREGRLKDRPVRIKIEILPYDDGADVDALLDDLARGGFIVRYGVGGDKYIQINNFAKHQRPHRNETPSEIPSIPDDFWKCAEVIPTKPVPLGSESEALRNNSEVLGSESEALRSENGVRSTEKCVPPYSPPAGRVDETQVPDPDPPPPKRRKRKSVLSVEQQERFDRFYQGFPRREDPGRAEKVWAKLDDGSPEFIKLDFPAILTGTARYAREVAHRAKEYVKLPATFLNARGWESDFQEPVKPRSRYDEFGTFTMPLRGGNPAGKEPVDGPDDRAGPVPGVPGGGGPEGGRGGAAEAVDPPVASQPAPAGGQGLGHGEGWH